eukprot:4883992-Pyramimonas_sp.AAC.2
MGQSGRYRGQSGRYMGQCGWYRAHLALTWEGRVQKETCRGLRHAWVGVSPRVRLQVLGQSVRQSVSQTVRQTVSQRSSVREVSEEQIGLEGRGPPLGLDAMMTGHMISVKN